MTHHQRNGRRRAQRGGAALELVMALPILIVVLALMVSLARAQLVKQCGLVAVRHAAWSWASGGEDGQLDAETLQGQIGAELSAEYTTTAADFLEGIELGVLGEYVPNSMVDSVARLDVQLESILPRLLEDRQMTLEFTLMNATDKGFWKVEKEDAGIFGFLDETWLDFDLDDFITGDVKGVEGYEGLEAPPTTGSVAQSELEAAEAALAEAEALPADTPEEEAARNEALDEAQGRVDAATDALAETQDA